MVYREQESSESRGRETGRDQLLGGKKMRKMTVARKGRATIEKERSPILKILHVLFLTTDPKGLLCWCSYQSDSFHSSLKWTGESSPVALCLLGWHKVKSPD